MTLYLVTLRACKAGSIGITDGERRTYEIEAPMATDASEEARRRAYAEGLEHTLIVRVDEEGENLPEWKAHRRRTAGAA